MIVYRRLKNWSFPESLHVYDADEAKRYALALGMGCDPLDERELPFVTESSAWDVLAMPTLAVVLGFPGSWMQDADTGIDFTKIVHGEEDLVLHRPLGASGHVTAKHRVSRIVDKGPGRGAVITYVKELADAASGEPIATVTHTTFARGDGGFSAVDGVSDAAIEPPAPMPARAPDRVVSITTLPQQALLYRLCADRNPLHSEPRVAAAAGFERPILHGLCTYGIACRALLQAWCESRPERLTRLFARFTAPVYPGETLRVESFDEGGTIRFRAIAVERDKVVLDAGIATFHPRDPS